MSDTDLAQRVADLEHRFGIVEDKEEITRLQYIYGYYLDNRMWDEIIDLFAENGASIEVGRRGRYVGKEHVRSYFVDVQGKGGWGLEKNQIANHVQLQYVITVDPDRQHARGRSRALIQMSALPDPALLRWAEGVYENTYVKENGVWKIAQMWWAPTFYAFMSCKLWFDSVPASDDVLPDAPSHPADADIGRIFIPFHYKHPVTGQETPVPKRRL